MLFDSDENPSDILYDNTNYSHKIGQFEGSIIIKLLGKKHKLVFSNKVEIDEEIIHISGLHLGVIHGKAFSRAEEEEMIPLKIIDFIISLPEKIQSDFDHARFSAIYPNIIRFLNTACLFYQSSEKRIDHLDFMKGEILNRPVALTKKGGVLIGDRLVIDEERRFVFYDTIVIQRNINGEIKIDYENFTNYMKSEITFVLLLGIENF
ncbi:MAG: hypothetical protein ACTSVU_07645 [Promethearchaeota archaeon]